MTCGNTCEPLRRNDFGLCRPVLVSAILRWLTGRRRDSDCSRTGQIYGEEPLRGATPCPRVRSSPRVEGVPPPPAASGELLERHRFQVRGEDFQLVEQDPKVEVSFRLPQAFEQFDYMLPVGSESRVEAQPVGSEHTSNSLRNSYDSCSLSVYHVDPRPFQYPNANSLLNPTNPLVKRHCFSIPAEVRLVACPLSS